MKHSVIKILFNKDMVLENFEGWRIFSTYNEYFAISKGLLVLNPNNETIDKIYNFITGEFYGENSDLIYNYKLNENFWFNVKFGDKTDLYYYKTKPIKIKTFNEKVRFFRYDNPKQIKVKIEQKYNDVIMIVTPDGKIRKEIE